MEFVKNPELPIFRVVYSRAANLHAIQSCFSELRVAELRSCLAELRVVLELPFRVVVWNLCSRTDVLEFLFYFRFIILSLHRDEVVNGTDVLKIYTHCV